LITPPDKELNLFSNNEDFISYLIYKFLKDTNLIEKDKKLKMIFTVQEEIVFYK